MAKNKIVYGNETLIDLTDDTVSANNLLSGATAHDRSGTQIVGSVSVPTNLDDLSDVNISSPTSGQALVYDSGNSEWVNGTVSGGHVIENDSGTDLTQRSNLQFKGTYSQDDSTNDRTIVNVTRTMTSQQFGQLASAEKAGLIIVTDDPASELDADDIAYDNTSSGLTATDVQSAIDEINLTNGGTIKNMLTIAVDNNTTSLVTSQLNLGNSTPVGTVGNTAGAIALFADTQYVSYIVSRSLTADRVMYMPDKAGTFALTRDVSDFTNLGDCGIGESVDITNKNYNNYIATVVITSMSPNLYFPFSIERGNLGSTAVKFLQGSWITASYGQAIELLASNTSIKLNSVYVNGTQLTGNARMYVAGRYPV